MLRPRLIPMLLVHRGGLVKTRRFGEPKYVGDPLNAVRIFNEKEVDELIVADIDAAVSGREPDYRLIASLAAECRMPLCYAGGVRTPEHFERIVSLGVEKVAVGAAAVATPELLTEAAARVGRQSVVAVMDVRAAPQGFEVFTHNGRRGTGLGPTAFARRAEEMGAGEILVNSIDADGEMTGYNWGLIEEVRSAVTLPITAVGGAGTTAHVAELIRRFGVMGACAGSLFVFHGKYRAVLIQYPSRAAKDELCRLPD